MTLDSQPLQDLLTSLGRIDAVDGRSVNLPIQQGSTLLFDTLSAFETARAARYEHGTLYYGRYGNDAVFALENSMAALDHGFGCIAVSSGLAAVTLALMSALKSGDHLLVADNVYEPTRTFCDNVLTRYGVSVTYFDSMNLSAFAAAFRHDTKAVMFEAPGSGTFEIPDIGAIAKIAKANGATSILDGTWATPVFCRPLDLGVDIVVHSGSKYIGGHADSMIGFIVCNESTFLKTRKTCLAFGERPGGQDVFLSLRGIRTLELRLKQADSAASTVANWLADQPQVLQVLHPRLPSCPGHENWTRDFSGAAGLFSVILRPCNREKIHAFVDQLRHFKVGVSWGGFESLVLPVSPHRTVTPWTSDGCVMRFSIGLESTDSLIADLKQALTHID